MKLLGPTLVLATLAGFLVSVDSRNLAFFAVPFSVLFTYAFIVFLVIRAQDKREERKKAMMTNRERLESLPPEERNFIDHPELFVRIRTADTGDFVDGGRFLSSHV